MHPPPSARQSCLRLSNPASAAWELAPAPRWPGLGSWAYLINTQTHLSSQCLHSPFPASAPASSCSPGHEALLSLNRVSQVSILRPSALASRVRGDNEEPSLGAAQGRFLHSRSPASRAHVVRVLAAARFGEVRTECLRQAVSPPPCGRRPCLADAEAEAASHSSFLHSLHAQREPPTKCPTPTRSTAAGTSQLGAR